MLAQGITPPASELWQVSVVYKPPILGHLVIAAQTDDARTNLTALALPSWPQDGCHSPWHNSHVQQGKHNAVAAISAPDIWKQSSDTWKTKVFPGLPAKLLLRSH